MPTSHYKRKPRTLFRIFVRGQGIIIPEYRLELKRKTVISDYMVTTNSLPSLKT
jgi:hypothetical protein